jgi:serine phosphatase RsbU (regulator of sigma subunit)
MIKYKRKSASLESDLLLDITKKITSTLDFEEVLDLIVDSLSQLVSYDAAGILLVDEKTGTLRQMATRGYDRELLEKFPLKINQGISGHVIKTKRASIISNVSKSTYYYPSRPETKSQITVPLFSGEDVIGVLVLESNKVNHFIQADLKRLTAFASLASIAIDNAKLYEDSLRKEHLESDLLVASKIQKALLPIRPPCIPGVRLEAVNIPSLIVGGDFYDFFRSDGNQLGIAIGDVSGKGTSGAILMAVVYAGFKSLLKEIYQVSEIVARLNNLIEEATTSGYFATFFLGIIDPSKNQLSYCNAGHNPPILIRQEKKIEYLNKGGMLLGFLADQSYTQEIVEFKQGDYLILYTDGVTEVKNPGGKEFGEARLKNIVLDNFGKSPMDLKNAILKAIEDFSGRTDFPDDITLLIARRE